jgi:hypothetical protein
MRSFSQRSSLLPLALELRELGGFYAACFGVPRFVFTDMSGLGFSCDVLVGPTPTELPSTILVPDRETGAVV